MEIMLINNKIAIKTYNKAIEFLPKGSGVDLKGDRLNRGNNIILGITARNTNIGETVWIYPNGSYLNIKLDEIVNLNTNRNLYYDADSGGWLNATGLNYSNFIILEPINKNSNPTNLNPGDIVTGMVLALSTSTNSGGATLTGKLEIYNRIEKMLSTDSDVTLTTTGASDLQSAITELTDGQILEVKTNATYSPITLPAGKSYSIRVAEGYSPKISGNNCIQVSDGCDNIIISGLILDGSSQGGNNNYQGTAISYLTEGSVVSNLIFHDLTISNSIAGSSVMLAYYWNNPNYYTNATDTGDMSNNIAFVKCNFFDACKDGTEGACLTLRAIKNSYILDSIFNNNNSPGRGIQLQGGVKHILVEGCKVMNIGGGNGEGIKTDSFSGVPPFQNTIYLYNNQVFNSVEGIDIDDQCEASVIGNHVYNCLTEGINLDDSSKGYFLNNVVYNCRDGFRLENGSIYDLKNNVSYNNSSNNYRFDDGGSEDSSNTTNILNSKYYNPYITIKPITDINTATYDLTQSDYILSCSYPSTGPITSITLMSSEVIAGRTVVIKDSSGNAGTNNITIDTEGAETIDGNATFVINTNYEKVMLYSDGSNWFTI